MDLKIRDLRVLVTAGASGIGLATARAFARDGARVHVCDVDTAALDALAGSDPGLTRSVCDVADPAAVARLFDTRDLRAGRPRRAGEQRRHRGSHGALRRRRVARLGAHARRQPHRAVPVRAARDPAAQGERQRRASPIFRRRPAASGFPIARRTPHRNGASSASPSRCRSSSVPTASASTRSAPARSRARGSRRCTPTRPSCAAWRPRSCATR